MLNSDRYRAYIDHNSEITEVEYLIITLNNEDPMINLSEEKVNEIIKCIFSI